MLDAKPKFMHDCNRDLRRKTGGAWGYFLAPQVSTDGSTILVMLADKTAPAAEVQSCQSCSTTTRFTIARSFTGRHGPIDMAGVNMRLFNPVNLEGVEVRFPDGRDWSGNDPF